MKDLQVYKRGNRSKGGINGYRYRKVILKPLLIPWIKEMEEKTGIKYILLEDGAPAYISRFDQEFLSLLEVKKMLWPGNSPDCNAIEHA